MAIAMLFAKEEAYESSSSRSHGVGGTIYAGTGPCATDSHTGHSANAETITKAGFADESRGTKVGAALAGDDELATRRRNLRNGHNHQEGGIEGSLSFG